MSNVGLMILAAGASTRLGSPKQLLPFRGRSLLRGAAETALASVCRPVVVVLGAFAARLREEVDGLPLQAVFNPRWENGPGSSLRTGLEALKAGQARLSAVDLDATVVMLCDQPLLTASHLDQLVSAHRTGDKPVAASEYDGVLGVPALFGRELFAELAAIEEAHGAKPIVNRYRDVAARVPFPEGAFDIDTAEDYLRLQNFCEAAPLSHSVGEGPGVGAQS